MVTARLQEGKIIWTATDLDKADIPKSLKELYDSNVLHVSTHLGVQCGVCQSRIGTLRLTAEISKPNEPTPQAPRIVTSFSPPPGFVASSYVPIDKATLPGFLKNIDYPAHDAYFYETNHARKARLQGLNRTRSKQQPIISVSLLIARDVLCPNCPQMNTVDYALVDQAENKARSTLGH